MIHRNHQDLDLTDPFTGDYSAAAAAPIAPEISPDGTTRTFRLKKPGSLQNTTFLNEFELTELTNSSTCNCAVFIGSFTADHQLIEGTAISVNPGESVSSYRRADGAAFIGISCSAGCDATVVVFVR
jgi:hypothetical protein